MSDRLDDLLAPRSKSDDPLLDQLRSESLDRAAVLTRQPGNPDQAAKAAAIARRDGLPISTVQRNLPAFEERERAKQWTDALRKYPALTSFAADPRNAAVAADDAKGLSGVVKAFDMRVERLRRDFETDGGILEQAGDYVTRRLYGLQGGFDRFAVASNQFFESLTPPAQRSREANAAMAVQQPKFRARAQRNEAVQALPITGETSWETLKARPNARNLTKFIAQQGASSLPDMVLALTSIPLYVTGRSGEIGQDRARNNGRSEATIGDVVKAAPAATLSAYLEKLGVEKILFPGAATALTRIGKAAVVEAGTEFAQEGIEYAGATLGTERGFDPAEALDQSVAGAVGGAGVGAGIRTAVEIPPSLYRGVGKAVDAVRKQAVAAHESGVIDKLASAAETTKLKSRDPEAFANLIQALGEQQDVQNVYVPAEAIREFMQSNDLTFEELAWGDDVEGQMGDALAAGGDIVLPVGKAVANMVGTPAWDALKGDIRLSAGGQSLTEAEAFQQEITDYLTRLNDDIDLELDLQRREREPRQKLFDSMSKKLTDAGYRLDVANKYALIATERAATRKARLGEDLKGDEYDSLTINQVLPPGLAAMMPREPQKPLSDALAPILKVMRGGQTVRSDKARFGPSLSEFIRKRGGIDDVGGDIEAIGAGKLKGISKKGQIKLIRKSRGEVLATKGASLLGDTAGNDNTPDAIAMAAWEAGYFPEFQERPTVDDLLTAISDELSGRKRYADDRTDETDEIRMAAQDLYQLLDQQGVDPETATDKEIAQAIERFQSAAVDGRGFGQITPMQARELSTPLELPTDPVFAEAVENTPAAKITDDGLLIDLVRVQKPDQEGAMSVRTGVFYLPKGSPNLRHYKASGSAYGGSEKFEGPTLIRRPIFVKGATGGKAPEAAYDAIKGKGEFKKFEKALMSVVTSKPALREPGLFEQNVSNFLEENGVEGWRGDEAIHQSSKGNQLRYALQELVIAHVVRDAGYDAVVGYSRGKNGPSISEVFDVRELSYPAHGMDSEIHESYYQSLFDDPAQPERTMTQAQRAELEARQKQGMIRRGGQKAVSDQDGGLFDAARDQRSLFQSAFHGSPHIFDRFSLDKIGTGEGNQAYGWGLYFAGQKQIAEHYRAMVKDMGKVREINARLSDLAKIMAADEISYGKYRTDAGRDAKAEYDRLMSERSDVSNAPGRLYEVEIPDDGDYLLWDASLDEQPDKVKAALKKLGLPTEDKARWTVKETANGKFTVYNVWGEASGTFKSREAAENKAEERTRKHNTLAGSVTYNRLVDQFPDPVRGYGGDPRQASLALRDAGIAGIKYLDGGSRSDGDGTYNYVVFDDNAVSIRAYEQSYADGPRGRVTFDSRTSVIDLFQERDLSTFLHEMGHVWLEELQTDATLDAAPDQLRTDWQVVQDWFKENGHEVANGVIPVEAHEMWARGVERYLMEGKAPSSALRRAFDAFRTWLVRIYGLADNLRAPITPEIREVMDRMFATDAEIEAVAEEQNIKAAFTDAAQAGMTEAEFDAYQKSITAARDEAFDSLLFKTMEDVRRRRTAEYKSSREPVEARVREEVDSRPVFRALSILRTKGGPKLSRAALTEAYGDAVLDQLPPIHSATGTDLDTVAEMAGFATGQDLVNALVGLEDRKRAMKEGGDLRSVRQATIDEETDAIMTERYGDPLSDGSIEEEALAAIHSERQGEVLATELRQLGRKSGNVPSPYSVAKEWAREKVAAGTVNDMVSRAAIQRYTRAASKAAKEAEKAIIAGDFETAFTKKQAQMLNNALIAEASRKADEIDKAVERMGKLARKRTIKSMDQDYIEHIHALLEQVDLKPRTQRSIDRVISFEAWATARQAEGYDVIVPESFADRLGQKNWSRMTVEELLDLDDAVKQIAHLGRHKQSLLDGKEKREFESVLDEMSVTTGMLPPLPPENIMDPGFWDRFKSGVSTADANLLKMETVFDWLDGSTNGVFNRVVFAPIAEAQDRENAMTEDYFGRIKSHMEAIGRKGLRRWQEKVSVPELANVNNGYPLQRQQLIALALNMGNAGNTQRVTDGYNLNEDAVRAMLIRELTADDWTFVQSVWDTIDTLWPQVAALERRVNGVEPEKVVATPFDTPFGTMRGGYYPAIYDSKQSLEAETQAGKAGDLFESTFIRSTTRASATKDRADRVKRPILLQLGVINRHLGEVIHDITHREAVMQADKFLSHPRVANAVDSTLGPAIRKQFRPWLKFIANQWAYERAGNEGIGKFLSKARANTTIVGMGFRASTVMMQIAGYSNSFEYVGARWVAPEIAKTAANPFETFRFVMERSGEIRSRMNNLDRDIGQEMNRLAGRVGTMFDVRRFMFHGIGYADRLVVIPTWMGAYNKALASGADEAAAIYEADKAVRKSQGAGSAKDLAAVQTGQGKYGEALKLMTMFYTYMSGLYQRQRTLGRDVKVASVRDMPALMARAWWLIVVSPLLAELLADRGPEEDEDWGLWAFKNMLFNMLGPIPIARDIARPAYAKATGEPTFEAAITPVQGAYKSVTNVAGDAGNIIAGDDTKRATRNALEFIGYTTGLVPGQVAAATQFLVDVGMGDADPEGFAEWWEGITKGKISDE